MGHSRDSIRKKAFGKSSAVLVGLEEWVFLFEAVEAEDVEVAGEKRKDIYFGQHFKRAAKDSLGNNNIPGGSLGPGALCRVESCHGIQLEGPTGLGLDTTHLEYGYPVENKEKTGSPLKSIGGCLVFSYLSQRLK